MKYSVLRKLLIRHTSEGYETRASEFLTMVSGRFFGALFLTFQSKRFFLSIDVVTQNPRGQSLPPIGNCFLALQMSPAWYSASLRRHLTTTTTTTTVLLFSSFQELGSRRKEGAFGFKSFCSMPTLVSGRVYKIEFKLDLLRNRM